MKRLLIIFLSLILTCAFFAQATTAPTTLDKIQAASHNFSMTLGLGQVGTATTGNALAYDVKFQTAVKVGFNYFVTPKFSMGLDVQRDTVKLARWAVVHNFLKPIANDNYQYVAYDVLANYYLARTDKLAFFLFAGLTEYTAPGAASKTGFTGGVGTDFYMGKHFMLESKVKFRHVQDFAVPVANVFDAGLAIGYRF